MGRGENVGRSYVAWQRQAQGITEGRWLAIYVCMSACLVNGLFDIEKRENQREEVRAARLVSENCGQSRSART